MNHRLAVSLFVIVLSVPLVLMVPACSDDPSPVADMGKTDGPRSDQGLRQDALKDQPRSDLRRDQAIGPDKGLMDLPVQKPDAKKPAPDAQKPDLVKPDAKKPDMAKPDAQKPDAPMLDKALPIPDLKKPDLLKPDLVKPDMLGPPTGCGYALPLYAGSLCGPSPTPCTLKKNEVLPGTASFRNGSPAIALDTAGEPRILASVASGGYYSFYGVRSSSGTWTMTQAPMTMATGGLIRDAQGNIVALTYAGSAGGGLLHTYNGTTFNQTATVSPSLAGYTSAICGWSHGFVGDQGGCMHMLMSDLSGGMAYLKRSSGGNFSAQSLSGNTAAMGGSVALSPTGTAHLAYWASAGSSWNVYWQMPPGSATLVAALGSNMLSDKALPLAVTDLSGAGTPHLLFKRISSSSPGTLELVYARQTGSTFSFTTLQADQSNPCASTACTVGATCHFDYTTYQPLAVVASGSGDVRLLFAAKRHYGTWTGTLLPPNSCYWQGGQYDGDLRLAWPQGSSTTQMTLAQNVLVSSSASAEAELDSQGTIHLAVYSVNASSTSGYTDVRYLRIGP